MCVILFFIYSAISKSWSESQSENKNVLHIEVWFTGGL